MSEAATLFRRSWSLYDAITAENHMFHRELYAPVADTLTKRHAAGPGAVLDLNCGNARFLAPALHAAPPTRYDGVDLSAAALAEAAGYLAGLDGVSLHESDMLAYTGASENRYDLIFTGFAVHHLDTGQKGTLFRNCSAILAEGGEMLMIDVVREEGQSLADYLAGYLKRMRGWTAVAPELIDEACEHVAAHDQPDTFSTLSSLAAAAGLGKAEIVERHGPHHLLRFTR